MATTKGRWVRVPLIGDVEGIVLLLPDEPLSTENWGQFMRSLDAMKPGLVAAVETPANRFAKARSEGRDTTESLVRALIPGIPS